MIFEVMQNLLSLTNFLYMNLGMLLGIIFGALPGLTTVLAVVLFTPMTFGMDPVSAMMLLLGLYCGGTYGGSITAILINTPGTPAASATCIDGYPLAQKGQAQKALDMALLASTIAGVISGIVLLIAAPQISKITLFFGPPEYFSLAVFGLSIIISVSSENLLSGLISGCMGLLLSTVGIDKFSGLTRYTFGNVNLMAGLDLLVLMIGVFAVFELMSKASNILKVSEKSISSVTAIKLDSQKGVSFDDMKRCFKTIIRSAFVGVGVGAMPGTGAAIASFISYDLAKKSSKNSENFGKGELEGVAATESGNNGVTGATLIPLLTLGIPGDSVTAVFMGALMVHGLVPGPNLFNASRTQVYAIIFGFLIINFIMLFQGKILLKYFAKIANVSDTLLIPTILLFCAAGAYSIRNSMFDLILIIVFGLFSFIMQKMKLSIMPLVLGTVLGQIVESNYRRSLSMTPTVPDFNIPIFFTRPISLFFLILAVVSVAMVLYKTRKEKQMKQFA